MLQFVNYYQLQRLFPTCAVRIPHVVLFSMVCVVRVGSVFSFPQAEVTVS